ncbi:MAG: hypothetical protein NC180_08105 [Muribaculaceae bacterium]|nr:hypothetical protein [Roseburia sp.]MCM1430495.1 hypothetical protein [Muribaculaceae bacterium]MCM1493168.1 hypothetical protein [Muribaculaceae bacterium]
MEKSGSSKRIMLAVLDGIGLLVFIVVVALLRPELEEERTTLEAENAVLAGQLQQVRDLEANLSTYTQQTDLFEKQIAEIIDKYPPNVREEDVVLYARDLTEGADIDVTSITINPANLLYSLNAPAVTDGSVAVTDDASADASAGTEEAAGAAPTGVDLGILDESQIVCPDYTFFVMVVSYDFTSDYSDMKSVFARLMSNRNRRNVADMSMTYDTETGLIVGNLGVNMYYLGGTDKIYEKPDAGTVIKGNENIFGTVR